MMQVSKDFAPPLKLLRPYFLLGGFSFLLCILFLFTFDIQNIHFLSPKVLSLVHLFLLNVLIMTIFGAMAQLIPVTLEVGHYSLFFYKLICPLLFAGTILMFFGFSYTFLLPYGGTLVFVSIFFFILEFFLTLRKVKKFTYIVKSLVLAHIFLLLGLAIGVLLSLAYSGLVNIDMNNYLKAHVVLLIMGYVCIVIISLSLVLLPMFSLSHGFSKKPSTLAIFSISTAVLCILLSVYTKINMFSNFAYILCLFAMLSFFYQCYIFYVSRVKKEIDIYVKFLLVSFYSLLIALILYCFYFITQKETYLFSASFLFLFGFFAFLIIAHLYKIIPFLVWFDKFAPLVGKKKVPMLKDIVPFKSATYQLFFSVLALFISSFALLLTSPIMFKAGLSFFLVSSIYLCGNLIYMIRFKNVYKR